ncbi:hypothetical protein MKX08_010453 [Trichoderma sp. CBMAI-0020]|nr:hypothetical protein MKX08_010453 [Trichoderma sp. CBMAI-0020]
MIEHYPVAVQSDMAGGWVCVEGKEDFEAIVAYMKAESFKSRYLVFSDKNKSEPDTIRLRLVGPKPGYLDKYFRFVGRSQDWTIPAMDSGPQMQQHGSHSNKLLKVGNEATYSPPTVETMTPTDLLATCILVCMVCMTAACKPPPTPTLTVPGHEWTGYHDMSPCALCTPSDDTAWMPPNPSELVLPGSAAGDGGDKDDKNDQYYLDEIPGDVRERLIISASSQPSSIIFKPHGTAFTIMPKHAFDSRLESPETKKKKCISDDSPKALRTKNMDKTKKSVRDKLLAGIAIGLKKAQNQQQQQAAQESQSFYEVATSQDSLDKEFHVNPRILQNLNSPSQSQNVQIPKVEEDEEQYQKRHSSRRSDILIDHFVRRTDQRQAVMGLFNDTPFVPPGVPQASALKGPGEGLRLFLRSACCKYGYRKLELNLLKIWHVKACHDLRGEPLNAAPVLPIGESKSRASLGTKEGSLAIYESDVPDEHGQVTTWIWLKICRSLKSNEQSGHFAAPDMPEDQEAWNIIAIPRSQVTVIVKEEFQSDAPNETTNVDNNVEATEPAEVKRTSVHVAMRYSRDGVPSMACSGEKGEVYSAWSDFRLDLNEVQWDDIQRDMATNSCLIYAFSKPGVGWVTVPPEQPEQLKRSGGGGVRPPSKLKQEVHLED